MTLVKFKSNPTTGMFNYLPNIWTDFFGDFMDQELASRDVFKSIPAVNIRENNDNFLVELAVPGLTREDFKIDVENGILTISAEKKDEKKEEDTRFTRKEFSYTSFSRTFTLPEKVNADQINAVYRNGVLELTLPKKDEAKTKPARKIKVS